MINKGPFTVKKQTLPRAHGLLKRVNILATKTIHMKSMFKKKSLWFISFLWANNFQVTLMITDG